MSTLLDQEACCQRLRLLAVLGPHTLPAAALREVLVGDDALAHPGFHDIEKYFLVGAQLQIAHFGQGDFLTLVLVAGLDLGLYALQLLIAFIAHLGPAAFEIGAGLGPADLDMVEDRHGNGGITLFHAYTAHAGGVAAGEHAYISDGGSVWPCR